MATGSDAEARALARLAGWAVIPAAQGSPMLDHLLCDLRQTIRRLRRAPGFALTVVATLALGIGANAALFSLLRAVVYRPLAVPDPARLVALSRLNPAGQPQSIPLPMLLELKAQDRVFESLCGYAGPPIFTVQAGGALIPSTTEFVTGDYFTVLGVTTGLGRLIGPEDVPPSGEPVMVAVVSHRFWQRHLNSDLKAVGRTLEVENLPVRLIGVAPPGFSGLQVDTAPDLILPATLLNSLAAPPAGPPRPVVVSHMIGRLRRGVTLDQARTAVLAAWPSVVDKFGGAEVRAAPRKGVLPPALKIESIETGFSPLRTRFAEPLRALFGLTGLLLALAIVNLSGLFLAASEDHELAIRQALGAGPWRLAQAPLLEAVLLSALGAAAALPLAWAACRVLGALVWTGWMPMTLGLGPDRHALLLTAALAITAGIGIGVIPAVLAGRRHALPALQRRGHGGVSRHASARWGVVAQVAISLVLVAGAGLFARSLAHLHAVDPGFPVQRLLLARLSPRPGAPPVEPSAYYPLLLGRIQALPGVESASLSQMFPAVGDETRALRPVARGDALAGSGEVGAIVDTVSPRFFTTVGVRLLEGRDLAWTDTAAAAPVAVINRSLASRLFPGGKALGQRVRLGDDRRGEPLVVVGVVADTTMGNLRSSAVPVLFRPALQQPAYARRSFIDIRAASGAATLAPAVRRTVESLGRDYVIFSRTAEEQLQGALSRERITMRLSALFATLAMLLACIGIYNRLARAVVRRRREIGLRMALGARRSDVTRMFLVEGLSIALVGVALGTGAALRAGPVVERLLFGVSGSDAMTLAASATLLAAACTLAGLVPARRAAAIDPMEALRAD